MKFTSSLNLIIVSKLFHLFLHFNFIKVNFNFIRLSKVTTFNWLDSILVLQQELKTSNNQFNS